MFIKSKPNGTRLGSLLTLEKGKINFLSRFLAAKSDEIKSKVKNIDAVSTGLKETVSKIKPIKLAELPVDK
jgi:hypothetical protein